MAGGDPIRTAYLLYKSKSDYKGSLNDFKNDLSSNPDVFNTTYKLFSEGGYNKGTDHFKKIMNIQTVVKKKETTQRGSTPTKQPSSPQPTSSGQSSSPSSPATSTPSREPLKISLPDVKPPKQPKLKTDGMRRQYGDANSKEFKAQERIEETLSVFDEIRNTDISKKPVQGVEKPPTDNLTPEPKKESSVLHDAVKKEKIETDIRKALSDDAGVLEEEIVRGKLSELYKNKEGEYPEITDEEINQIKQETDFIKGEISTIEDYGLLNKNLYNNFTIDELQANRKIIANTAKQQTWDEVGDYEVVDGVLVEKQKQPLQFEKPTNVEHKPDNVVSLWLKENTPSQFEKVDSAEFDEFLRTQKPRLLEDDFFEQKINSKSEQKQLYGQYMSWKAMRLKRDLNIYASRNYLNPSDEGTYSQAKAKQEQLVGLQKNANEVITALTDDDEISKNKWEVDFKKSEANIKNDKGTIGDYFNVYVKDMGMGLANVANDTVMGIGEGAFMFGSGVARAGSKALGFDENNSVVDFLEGVAYKAEEISKATTFAKEQRNFGGEVKVYEYQGKEYRQDANGVITDKEGNVIQGFITEPTLLRTENDYAANALIPEAARQIAYMYTATKAFGTGALAQGLGMSVFYYNDSYKDALQQTGDELTAHSYATVMGVIEGLANKLMPDAKLFGMTGGKKAILSSIINAKGNKIQAGMAAARSFLGNVAKENVEEIGTEGANKLINMAYNGLTESNFNTEITAADLKTITLLTTFSAGAPQLATSVKDYKTLKRTQEEAVIYAAYDDKSYKLAKEVLQQPETQEAMGKAEAEKIISKLDDYNRYSKVIGTEVSPKQVEAIVPLMKEKEQLQGELEVTDENFKEDVKAKIAEVDKKIKTIKGINLNAKNAEDLYTEKTVEETTVEEGAVEDAEVIDPGEELYENPEYEKQRETTRQAYSEYRKAADEARNTKGLIAKRKAKAKAKKLFNKWDEENKALREIRESIDITESEAYKEKERQLDGQEEATPELEEIDNALEITRELEGEDSDAYKELQAERDRIVAKQNEYSSVYDTPEYKQQDEIYMQAYNEYEEAYKLHEQKNKDDITQEDRNKLSELSDKVNFEIDKLKEIEKKFNNQSNAVEESSKNTNDIEVVNENSLGEKITDNNIETQEPVASEEEDVTNENIQIQEEVVADLQGQVYELIQDIESLEDGDEKNQLIAKRDSVQNELELEQNALNELKGNTQEVTTVEETSDNQEETVEEVESEQSESSKESSNQEEVVESEDTQEETQEVVEEETQEETQEEIEEVQSDNGLYTIRRTNKNGSYSLELISNKTGKPANLTTKRTHFYYQQAAPKWKPKKTQFPEGIKAEEANSFVAENSEDVEEVVEVLNTTPKYIDISGSKDDAIYEAIGGGVKRQSFIDNDDVNNIGNSLARSYFRPNGSSIDQIAQEASSMFGNKTDSDAITVEDVVDFMKRFNNGAHESQRQMTPEYENAINRFMELTGLPNEDSRIAKTLKGIEEFKERAAKLAEQQSVESQAKLIQQYDEWFESLSPEEQAYELNQTYEAKTESSTNGQTESSTNDTDKTQPKEEGNDSISKQSTSQKFKPLSLRAFNELVDKLSSVFKKFGANVTIDLDAFNAKAKDQNIQELTNKEGEVYGAKLPDGTIYLNPEKMNANTPIHEFAHVWEQLVPTKFKQGVEVLKQTKVGQDIFNSLKINPAYDGKTDDQLWNEAMVTHIGNMGESQYNQSLPSKLANWTKDLFNTIGRALGMKVTPDMQLKDFTKGALKEIMGETEIVSENIEFTNNEIDFQSANVKEQLIDKIHNRKSIIQQARDTFNNFSNKTFNTLRGFDEEYRPYLKDVKEESRRFERTLTMFQDRFNMEIKGFDRTAKSLKKRLDKKNQGKSRKQKNEIFNKYLGVVNSYLSGDKASGKALELLLDPSEMTVLDGMRATIDELSTKLQLNLTKQLDNHKNKIQELEDEDKQRKLNGEKPTNESKIEYHNKKVNAVGNLIETIENNKEAYMHRAYKIFTEVGWEPSKQTIANAVDHYVDQETKRLEKNNEIITDDVREKILIDATNKVNKILQVARESGDPVLMAQAMSGSTANVILKKKNKNLPEPVLELLGQIKDPIFNYSNTVMQQAKLIASYEHQEKLRTLLVDSGLATEGTMLGGVRLFPKENGWQFMEGLEGTPELKDFLRGYETAFTSWGPMDNFIALTSQVKTNLTAFSPTTAFRNLWSGVFLMASTGHNFLTNPLLVKNATNAYKIISGGKNAEYRALRDELILGGVLQDGGSFGEIRALIQDSKVNNKAMARFGRKAEDVVTSNIVGKGISKGFGKVKDVMLTFYSFGDDFYKVTAYLAEKEKLMNSYGMSEVDAKKRAAAVVTDLYPTYSKVTPNLKRLRRFPFAGTFVSFPAEVVRTKYNTFRYAYDDVKAGRTKMGINKIFGVFAEAAMYYGIPYLSKLIWGYSDEEEEAMREARPDYQKNAQVVYLGRDGKSHMVYDLSSLMPIDVPMRPVNAIMNNKKWDQGLWEFAKEAAGFAGVDVTVQTIMGLYYNENSWGTEISRSDELGDKAIAYTNYVLKSAGPGAYKNFGEFARANKVAPELFGGKTSVSGYEYTNTKALANVFGLKYSQIDYQASLSFTARAEKDQLGDNLTKYRRRLERVESPDEIAENAAEIKRLNDAYFQRKLAQISHGRKSMLSDEEIFKSFNGSVSQRDWQFLKEGEIPPIYPMSDQALENRVKYLKGKGEEGAAERLIENAEKAKDVIDLTQENDEYPSSKRKGRRRPPGRKKRNRKPPSRR